MTWMGSSYVTIPNDSEFIQLFKTEVTTKEKNKGIQHYISLKSDAIWPIVYLKKVRRRFVKDLLLIFPLFKTAIDLLHLLTNSRGVSFKRSKTELN